MCDTIVIVEPGRVFFAKNSDRDANEGQNLEWHSRRLRAPGARVRCTWITIPDVQETRATLISRPFWIWGAEMGSNECGVTIGNEAVFTSTPNEAEPGLIGMDLLRLALERADTAEAACEVITKLLEEYGQGGRCGLEGKNFTYDNSFIIADPYRAFVLETAGRNWTVEAIQGPRSISNGLTIQEFADRYTDKLRTKVCACRERQGRTQELAYKANSVADIMRILQDHGGNNAQPAYGWSNGAMSAPCVHGGGVLASSQTTASWVSELRPDKQSHWVTGTAAPCISLFKPAAVTDPVPLKPAMDTVNDSLWWRHELLHRQVLRNPEPLSSLFVHERDDIQRRWLETPPPSKAAFIEADAWLARWVKAVQKVDAPDVRPLWVRRYWKKRNQLAGLELAPAAAALKHA